MTAQTTGKPAYVTKVPYGEREYLVASPTRSGVEVALRFAGIDMRYNAIAKFDKDGPYTGTGALEALAHPGLVFELKGDHVEQVLPLENANKALETAFGEVLRIAALALAAYEGQDDEAVGKHLRTIASLADQPVIERVKVKTKTVKTPLAAVPSSPQEHASEAAIEAAVAAGEAANVQVSEPEVAPEPVEVKAEPAPLTTSEKVLAALGGSEQLTVNAIAQEQELSRSTVKRTVKVLLAGGQIEDAGEAPSGGQMYRLVKAEAPEEVEAEVVEDASEEDAPAEPEVVESEDTAPVETEPEQEEPVEAAQDEAQVESEQPVEGETEQAAVEPEGEQPADEPQVAGEQEQQGEDELNSIA